jgi:hypothetical protein
MKEKYIGHNLIHVVTKIASKLHFQEKIQPQNTTPYSLFDNLIITTV